MRMRNYLQILFFIALGFSAKAITYNVTVQNFSFTPSVLVINQGDVVTWTNVGGFHNVNGGLGAFPLNPEGFTSGAAGAGWTFSKTFTIPGTYGYQCDPHAPNMAGSITVNGPLPIELKSISAIVSDGICKVEWKTDKEESISMFTLQKSTNALDFKDVVDINANHMPSTYSYMDDMGADQYVYYRVKIRDDNNAIKYTPIRLAQNDVKITKNTLTLLPNPYVDHFHISVQAVKSWVGAIMVYDITGRVIYSQKYNFEEGHNYIHIENSDQFPKGHYIVAVRNTNNKEVLSASIIKE
jgi:plastocyanin